MALLAAGAYESGVRSDSSDWRKYAVAMWAVAAFSAVGAGHWGGVAQHEDVVPEVLLEPDVGEASSERGISPGVAPAGLR